MALDTMWTSMWLYLCMYKVRKYEVHSYRLPLGLFWSTCWICIRICYTSRSYLDSVGVDPSMQQWADKHPVGFASLSQGKHIVDNPLTSHSHLRTVWHHPIWASIQSVKAFWQSDPILKKPSPSFLRQFLCNFWTWLRGTDRERITTFTYHGYIILQRCFSLSPGSVGL